MSGGPPLTPAMKSALKWLINRGGDGVFAERTVLHASGERAGVMVSTWSKLERAELIERHDRRRRRVTPAGYAIDLKSVVEAESTEREGR